MRKSISVLLIMVMVLSLFTIIPFTASAATISTYDQYKADYYLNYSGYDYFLSEDFKMPYRTVVEHNRNDINYQSVIVAWQLATFDLANVLDYSKKRVGYYEAFLFDILYNGYEPTSATGIMNKSVKAMQASTFKNVCKLTGESLSSYGRMNIANMSSDDISKLGNALQACDELQEVFGTISNIGKILSYASDVEDLIYKLCKVSVVMKLGDEYADVLKEISSNTTDYTMSAACLELAGICENMINEAEVIALMSSELLAVDLGKYAMTTLWTELLEYLTGYGIAIKVGQGLGKFISNAAFSTDEIVENYYEMDALYDFENELVKVVKGYASSFNGNNSVSNAKHLNAAYEMLLGVYELGCDITIKHASLFNDDTQFALFISTVIGRHDDFVKYKATLESIKQELIFRHEFANGDLYNCYLEERCADVGDEIGMEPVIVEATPKENEETLDLLKQDIFLVSDITIRKDWKLTSDYTTYGDFYLSGGTLDLNGHTLRIEGNLIQSGGEMYIHQGTLEVEGDYRIQTYSYNQTYDRMDFGASYGYLVMDTVKDKVEIQGNFYTQSGAGNTDNKLVAGTMEIGGDFKQLLGNYYNFSCGGTHTVILNGADNTQKVTFDSTSSHFNNLKLTKDKDTGYIFNPDNCWNTLYLDTDIASVTVTADKKTVKQASSLQLTSKVNGINVPSQEVTWSVSGNTDSDTAISDKGILAVGLNENAEKLTVTAVSVEDPTKSASIEIAVEKVERIVNGIFITPTAVSAIGGEKFKFTAYVYGVFSPSQEVTWMVSDNHSKGTYIDSEGVLIVASNETSDKVTVTATSVADPTKSASVTIDVYHIKVVSTVGSVTVTLGAGEKQQLQAVVTGTNNPDTSVIWSVSGNNSKDTTVSATGLVSVAEDETADMIVVRATSVENPEKYGEFAINVEKKTEPRFLGDVDGSGEVDTVDATYIQRYSTHVKVPFTDEEMMLGDVDGDGDVTAVDATYILRYATRVKTPYPIGEKE